MPKQITPVSFRKYGKIIHYPDKAAKCVKRNLFRIVLSEEEGFGWRIAYLVVRDRTINKLESHSDTFESFEPVCGRSLLYVSVSQDPEKIDCFLLDRPIVLNKGIWHGVITLGPEAEIKITENAKVSSAYWKLGFVLNGAKRLKE